MATRLTPFWPRPATTSGSLWPGSGLCALCSGPLSGSSHTAAAPLHHKLKRLNSLFHRRLAFASAREIDATKFGAVEPRVGWIVELGNVPNWSEVFAVDRGGVDKTPRRRGVSNFAMRCGDCPKLLQRATEARGEAPERPFGLGLTPQPPPPPSPNLSPPRKRA